MPGLLYFLADRDRTITPDDLRRIGLGHAFDRRVAGNNATGALGGRNGVVLADPTRVESHRIGYYPDRQQWFQMPMPDVNAWVGRYTDAPVKPEDLARAEQLDGHWVTLGDEQRWLAPVARAQTEHDGELRWHNALPAATTIDAEGHWVEAGVLPRYAPLWPIATAFWDQWMGAKEDGGGPADTATVSFDFAGANDAALAALAANYRLGKAEVALLGLFNDQTVLGILLALVDGPTVQEWLKKKTEQGG